MKPTAAIRSFLALTGSSLLAISYSHAGTLYWDGLAPAGAPGGGGPATWSTSLTNWDNTQSADSSTAWVNANLDIAVFGGTASPYLFPVTLGSNITVGGLRFDTTGYVINTGASTLSFGTGSNTILFNNGIAAATITGSVGGTGNVILSNTNYSTPGTLTFNGASAGGWSGTTTIGAGMTLTTASTVALTNKVLGSTTGGITLNGGTIQFTRDGNTDLDAINNSAIGVNAGGTFSVTASTGGTSANETIGTVTVNSGQMNFVQTANIENKLVLGGLSRGASTTSTVNFSSAALGTAKIVVTGAGGATAANEIYNPWATVGIAANTQTDYAVFNASNEVGARGIGATAQSTWSTAHAATSNYTLTNAAGTASQLSATRIINTLRNTAGTAQNIASITSNVLTVSSSTYANGDVVVTGATVPTGLAKETVYYVVNNPEGDTTFQLAATPGGPAITGLTHAASSPLTGGIRLSSGNNLETYGILNGSATTLGIGGATGAGELTTPTGGGSLYLTTGAGAININAPIKDNGGAVTVVKSGNGGRLVLSGNNTFSGGLVVNGGIAGSSVQLFGTQSFTGGIILNSGGIGDNSANSTPYTLAATLNGNAITANGPSHLVVEGTLGTTSTIAINSNAILKLGGGNGTLTVQGVVSGSGVLDVNANNLNSGQTLNLTNTLNSFTGDVIYTEQNGTRSLNVNSIGDSGKVTFGLGASSQTFALNTGAAALTFSTRQFELAGTTSPTLQKISNNSANPFLISTDLLTTATGNRTLTLGGSGAGLGTFGGKLADGSLTSLAISKADASNTWTLTNTGNTYSGGTSVAAGTLTLGGNDVLGSGNVTVSGGILQLGTFSDTVGVVSISGGTIDGTSGVLTGSSVVASHTSGTSTISAILGGSGSLNRFGSGGATNLTKANTYSGGTNVVGGTLAVGASATLGQNVVGNAINIKESGILTLAAVGNSGSNQTITLTSSSTSGGRAGNLAVLGLGFNGLPVGAISQANTVGGVIALNGVTGYNTDLSSLLTGKNLFLGSIGTSTFTGVAGTVAAGNGSLYRLGGGGGQITFNTANMFTSTNGVQVGSFLTNGTGTVVINAAQDYSGGTTVSAGTLTLSGAGSANSSTSFTLNGGKVFLDYTSSNIGRIGAVTVALSNGGELSLSGHSGSTIETIGNLSIGIGSSTVTVKANTLNATLSGGVFSRSDSGTALFRGTALGGSATVMGKVLMTDVSTLTGANFVGTTTLNGAGASDATKDVKIIPYLVGGTTDTDTGSTFVTYDSTLGFRALSTTNQFNTTATAGTNVRLAAAQTGIGSMSINSLVIANTGSSTITDGQTLTVASGAVLFSSAGTIAPSTSTGILAFGTAPGVITTPSNGVISARVTGSGGIVKAGSGSLALSSTLNTFSGGIVLNAGTLTTTADTNLGNTGNSITVNGVATWNSGTANNYARDITINEGAVLSHTGGNFTYSGVVSGSGTLNATGSNVVQVYSNTGSTFTGALSTAYGTNWGNIGDSTNVINLGNSTTGFVWIGADKTLSSRVFTLSNTGNGVIGASGTGGTTFNISTDIAFSGAAGARTLQLIGINTGNNTFSGKITDGSDATSVVSLNKATGGTGNQDGTGTWILTGANTYTGKTTISEGVLGINSIQNAGSTTANALGTPAAGVNSIIDMASGTTLRYSGTGHSSDRVINHTTTNGSTITLDASGPSGTFALTGGVTNAGTSNTSTVILTGTGLGSQSGSIVNGTVTNAAAVTKNGTGTWTLGGANYYTGVTTVGGGVLKLDHANALPGGIGASGGTSALTITSGGIVGLANGDFTRGIGTGVTQFQFTTGGGGFAAYGADRTVTPGTLSFGVTAGTHIIGTLVLSAADADSTLIWSSNVSFGGSQRTVQVNNGSAAVDARFSGALTGGTSSGIDKTGLGKLQLTNDNTYTGATAVTAGTLELGNNGATGRLSATASVSVASGASLSINRSDAFSESTGLNNKTISGGGSLVQAGGGTTTFSLTHSYTGTTTVSNGTLIVNGNISTSSLTTVENGAILKGQGTVGAITVNAGGTLASGTSIESLASGNLTLLADAIFEQEIDDAFAGGNTSGDLTAVTGTLNLALTNDSVLNLIEVGSSGLWSVGDKITLISYTGLWNGGLFEYLSNVLNDNSTFSFSGVTWEFDYNDLSPGDNFTTDLTTPNYVTMTVVPEPRAALLGGLGMLLLLRRRRQ